MKLNIFRRDKDGDSQAPVKIEVPKSLAERVWDAPTDHNRATRRAAGLLSKVWRWASPAELGNQEQAPRYIRRHYSDEAFRGHRTRRQRKARARIVRIVLRKGIA